ncbi:phage tail protein [Pseudomonas sp. C1C7]|uniref:tail fiber assembly protein n=1 Tax=Pseudomonas sp. C1C7 TaxID=2735272 RepID=UPI0015867BF1|nr:tail fiber assembly protein [Pseudomonas sp. C1C7]NUT73456.1 phage tail protein [Pseudomonas sp. C1C7]
MFNYLLDSAGALTGPVKFPVTPGIGVQLPANAIELSFELPPAEPGRTWVFVSGVPRELVDRRGEVYLKENGARRKWTEFGELPDTYTIEPSPGDYFVWGDGTWKLDEAARLSGLKAEILVRRDVLLRDAVLRIAPLQYAEDIGDASQDEQLALLELKLYSVELNRIEMQAGFPNEVMWPITPGTPAGA